MTADPLVALAERLQARCLELGITVATAESCTGGLLAHAITEVPGSSGYLAGGFVTYSDEAKTSLLGVPPLVLEAHGAVSAQTARTMAEGARTRLSAHLGVSITGVAGPGGGTPAKPVGLTYIAVVDDHGVDVRRYAWTGDRSTNKRSSAAAALELLCERLDAFSAGHPDSAGLPGHGDEPGGFTSEPGPGSAPPSTSR